MHSAYLWHKFYLLRNKVVWILLLLILLQNHKTVGQINGSLNLPNFDNQKIHYGFLIGTSFSQFDLKYSDEFVELELDTLHSIVPRTALGFKLGFIADFHFYDILDARLGLTVGFNQFVLDYRFTDGFTQQELVDPTYVELPLLLKYKSVRRVNRRMYFLGGINPGIRASGSKDKEGRESRLLLSRYNLSLEIGAGFDLYQPLFKFSPEVRYSFGLNNVLDSQNNDFSAGIDRLSVHTITFFITFEGGPSEIKKVGKKKRR